MFTQKSHYTHKTEGCCVGEGNHLESPSLDCTPVHRSPVAPSRPLDHHSAQDPRVVLFPPCSPSALILCLLTAFSPPRFSYLLSCSPYHQNATFSTFSFRRWWLGRFWCAVWLCIYSILWQKLKEGKTLCAYLYDSNLSFWSGSLSNQQIHTQHLMTWKTFSRLHPDHHNVLVFDWTGSGVTRPTSALPYNIFPSYFPLRFLSLIPAYVPHVCLIKKRDADFEAWVANTLGIQPAFKDPVLTWKQSVRGLA